MRRFNRWDPVLFLIKAINTETANSINTDNSYFDCIFPGLFSTITSKAKALKSTDENY